MEPYRELYEGWSMFSYPKNLINETVVFVPCSLVLSWYRITPSVSSVLLYLEVFWGFFDTTRNWQFNLAEKNSIKKSPSWSQNKLHINFLVNISVLNWRGRGELLCYHWVEWCFCLRVICDPSFIPCYNPWHRVRRTK